MGVRRSGQNRARACVQVVPGCPGVWGSGGRVKTVPVHVSRLSRVVPGVSHEACTNEIFKKTNKKTYSNNDNVALQESYEWLVKCSERRAVWHSIRNEFCFEYANISLTLTRKLQTAHYSQCGRCGRTTHDALDSFVCPLDGFDSLPPLNQEDEDKRKEEGEPRPPPQKKSSD